MPTRIHNEITGDKKNQMEFNHLSNLLCFQYLTKKIKKKMMIEKESCYVCGKEYQPKEQDSASVCSDACMQILCNKDEDNQYTYRLNDNERDKLIETFQQVLKKWQKQKGKGR